VWCVVCLLQERKFWHSHAYEVTSGILYSPRMAEVGLSGTPCMPRMSSLYVVFPLSRLCQTTRSLCWTM
jgi:hypothetical protein